MSTIVSQSCRLLSGQLSRGDLFSFSRSIANNSRLKRTIFSGSSKGLREGDPLPGDKVLVENDPMSKFSAHDVFGVKKGVLFGVPGAFTPGCSSKHVPSYVTKHEEFRKKGVNTIACMSVNDAFVMSAWGKEMKCDGKVRMLADPSAKFAKAIRMDKDMTELLGNVRSKRFAMIINNGKIVKIFIEPDGSNVTCTIADNVLKALKDENSCDDAYSRSDYDNNNSRK